MKILVQFSGGKDSQACLVKAVNDYGKGKVTAMFCDTGWEHADTIRYIRRIKRDIKKGKHNSLYCHMHRDILGDTDYPPLEIAARFLRRAGYSIDIRVHYISLSPLCFGRPLSCMRYVFIVY